MVKSGNTKAKKRKYKKLDAASSLPLTSNRYNLLHNDINEDDKDNTHTLEQVNLKRPFQTAPKEIG